MREVVCMYLRLVCPCDFYVSIESNSPFGKALAGRNSTQGQDEMCRYQCS